MVLEGIIDSVKEAAGYNHAYPAKEFVLGFAPPDPSLFADQQKQNQPGERPGKQREQSKVSLRRYLLFAFSLTTRADGDRRCIC